MLGLEGQRAVSLLRVSSSKQATKDDDIPAQRALVNEFIKKQELELVKEFIESGVSGFKTRVKDRDALQTIKEMADNREFDVLVVYKSDRIGRTTDESPLVISYLNQNGIRVFTVSGQELKTETLTDELITYLEFWRNKGESVKISERATDYRKIQVLNGKYAGGSQKMVPFGYRTVNRGSVNEKGKNVLDFEIDPEDAELVKTIYKLSIENNMGSRRIAKWLNENGHGHRAKNGKYWSFRTITYMLTNPMYKGCFHMYSTKLDETFISEQQDHLIIIPEDLWEKNQRAVQGRKRTIGSKPTGSTASRVLLSGLVYCGHCGEKMNLWANHRKYTKKNGEVTRYIRDCYKCFTSMKYNGQVCEGQTTYSAQKIDSIVEAQTIAMMKELSEREVKNNLKQKLAKELDELKMQKREGDKLLESKLEQIDTLKKEIPLGIAGKSIFKVEDLYDSLSLIQKDIDDLLEELRKIEKQIEEKQTVLNDHVNLETGIDTWEERYEKANLLSKKALINQLIDKVIIRRDEVEINYKITVNAIRNCGSEIEPSALFNGYKKQPQKLTFNFTRKACI
ncbi:MAG TPA: recombinase family protein [Petrimonas sp.]|nr:recombinase family protein [Petrimonas sp.]